MSDSHAPPDPPDSQLAGTADANSHAFPASPAQESFFYLEKLQPAHPAFNVPVRFALKGVLDRGLLKAAFEALVARHESLRTHFVEDDGNLLQVITTAGKFSLPCDDISHLSGTELETEIDRLGTEEAHRRFDLSSGPLFRASLIKAASEHYILQITFHHSVADGWSIGIMTDEFSEFYNALLEERDAHLDPLTLQYVDFTIWHQEFLEAPELTAHLEYWKGKLAGYQELELPTDRPRPAVKSWNGDVVSRILRPSVGEKVARISRDRGVTMFHVFLAAFKAVVSRYTGLEDIAVGSPVAGRSRTELEPIIGTFINSVILRTDLTNDPTFGELTERVRDTVNDAIAHQDLPFEQLVKALQPRRDAGRNPLFQINFTHQRDFAKPVSLGGARLTAMPPRTPGAIFDLHFFMVERADGWRASCDFARDLFDRETMERLLQHFEIFLEAAVADPNLPLSKLPLLTSSEKDAIQHWSGGKIAYPSESSLGELFLAQATRQPDRIALTHEGRSISYQLLAASALGLRARLIQEGVKAGDRVALCAPSVPEMISAQLAILLAGATCVPLDPDYPAERLQFMLADSAAKVLLTTRALAAILPDHGKTILLTPLADTLVTPALAEIHVPAGGVSHVFYTSGSTGQPKGVMVNHRGIARLALGGGFMDCGPNDTFLQAAPISFDASTLEIWMPLLHGGRIVLTSDAGPSLPAIARAIREQGVNCLWLTAGLFQTMVDEHLTDLKGLRYLLAGGDILSPDHVRRAFDALPNTTLINGYGPTENTTFTCCRTITRADLERVSIPIGQPLGNTTAHILDSKMQPVPVGVPGELYTGGDGLAVGYLGNEELTNEKFPTLAGLGRVYRTGDLCRWDANGVIEFLGRCDNQVKIRGFRIEPGEIEARLASHPSVLQTKVAVRGTSAESKRIVAWVVPTSGSNPEPSEISAYLSEFLPAYMRPEAIAIIDSLPLSANGKVDVSRLPDPSRQAGEKTSEAPVGATEEKLAAMWSDLLETSNIGRDDDFFALGGHSLMALRLFSRINREFNLTLPLAALLGHPTIRELAKLVTPAVEPVVIPKPTAPTKGHFVTLAQGSTATPLFCIHGGDGGVLFYRNLAAMMPADLPFHAIESLELGNSGKIESCSIEETATAYLQILLENQPVGPFRLAGYSFGGVVAHEMACQLEKLGHVVEFLGLIDTHNPSTPTRRYSLPERLRVFWQQNSNAPLFTRIGKVRQRFSEGVRTHRRIKAEVQSARATGPAESYSDLRRVQVREENWRAMKAYTPRPFKGRITLFKTSTLNDKIEYATDYGWAPLALDGLDIVSVAGEHLTLFAPENINHLADVLAASLPLPRQEGRK